MRVRIHRGAHEIGGNCVEVEQDSQRIVLDVGRPLTAGRDEVVPLPDIAGLGQPDDATLAVLISHHHADHWGLLDQVRVGLPIWMGCDRADPQSRLVLELGCRCPSRGAPHPPKPH